MLEEGKVISQRGNLTPGKRFHTVLTSSQTTLQGGTEAQTRMGHWWTRPHLDQDY